MEITNVKIYPVGKSESFIGYASVTFDNCFVVKGIRVMKSRSGHITAVSPEKRQRPKDKEMNRRLPYFHPVNQEMRLKLDAAVAEAVAALPPKEA